MVKDMVWSIRGSFSDAHGSGLMMDVRWFNSSQDGEERDLCWSHAADDNVHGVVDGCIHLVGMDVVAPYGRCILCGTVDQCKRTCPEGRGVIPTGGAGQAAEDTISCANFPLESHCGICTSVSSQA